jgi:transcriptional regulator GlxA family with amidase domain
MRIQIILFDGFDELDSIAPYEVLHSAAEHQAGWVVEFAALEGPRVIRANHGTRLFAQAKLGPVKGRKRPDVVIVPGGGWIDRNPQGARAEVAKGRLPAILAELHRAGTLTCSVCTGTMILASAGLLKGRPAITHHDAVADLRASGAKVIRRRVVDDGDIITAGGVTSGLDLALHLVTRLAGAQLMRKLENALEYRQRKK